jgi:nicotinate-nucleotide adenylyltransferase
MSSGCGVFGGAFDPPHNGHVELVRAAKRHFGFERLLVLVATSPGHREVCAPARVRHLLAQRAFPVDTVELDDHARTIDMLRARRLDEPVILVGADELIAFPTWKEPEAVLELAQIGVATRPGVDRDALESVRATLSWPDRVELFEIDPVPVSSTAIRRRAAAGEPIADLVPEAVASEIARLRLYRETGSSG